MMKEGIQFLIWVFLLDNRSCKKATSKSLLCLFILILGISASNCTDSKLQCHSKNSDAIDKYIWNLKYSNDEVLVYNAKSKINYVPNVGTLDEEDNFFVITRNKKNLKTTNPDIGVIASNEHTTYPGVLLLANKHLVDNSPEVVAVNRASITYTVDLPGMAAHDGGFTIVPSFQAFRAASNKALEVWFQKYSKTNQVVANFQTDYSFAYSKELLRVKFGAAFKNTVIETSIDFDSVKNQEKLVMVYRFKQIYYTISVQPTKRPSDLFDCKVTLKDIIRKNINERNPPVIVDSVSYGRSIYVILTTSSTDKEAKAILKNNIKQSLITNENQINYEEKLKDLSIQVFVVGGSSDSIALVNARSLEDVSEVVINNANFSRNHMGYPLSFSTQFIKDNSRAMVNMATEYTEITRTVFKKGVISIVHHGFFVTSWTVTWNEISYNKRGEMVVHKKNWEKNGKKLTAPFEEDIELPGNTRDIQVFCKYITGDFWQWWRTLIDRKGIDLVRRREFRVSGTTLTAAVTITPNLE